MEEIMRKRQKEADDTYEAQWDEGRGSHHPDYDPGASGTGVDKASRVTEELYNAIVKNDVKKVYKKIEEGANVNFVFGPAYQCPEGYTPLMVAAHRCADRLLTLAADAFLTKCRIEAQEVSQRCVYLQGQTRLCESPSPCWRRSQLCEWRQRSNSILGYRRRYRHDQAPAYLWR